MTEQLQKMKGGQNQGRFIIQSANDEIANFNQVNYLQITRQQHGQRIDNFLLTRLKGLPRSHLYQMIRCDEIRINKKRCKPHDRLQRGDIVRIAPIRLATKEKPIISDDLAQSLLSRVVYEDDGLMVLNKPSGMAVHGGSGEQFGVIEALRHATGKKYLELVHRIDKDTSGLLMVAKKRSTLKQLQQDLQQKTLQKTYLCLVKGWTDFDDFLVDKPLLRYTLANGERRVKVDYHHQERKNSQTLVKTLAKLTINGEKVSLIEAKPLTGRTHQIRVHLASLGHGLLGDDKYYINDTSRVRRLCLHAWRLQIVGYPLIQADLPDDLKILVGDLKI